MEGRGKKSKVTLREGVPTPTHATSTSNAQLQKARPNLGQHQLISALHTDDWARPHVKLGLIGFFKVPLVIMILL